MENSPSMKETLKVDILSFLTPAMLLTGLYEDGMIRQL